MYPFCLALERSPGAFGFAKPVVQMLAPHLVVHIFQSSSNRSRVLFFTVLHCT